MGHEASFAVQLNGARGLIDAKIQSPSGATEECSITELDAGKTEIRTCFCQNLLLNDVKFRSLWFLMLPPVVMFLLRGVFCL